MFASVFHSDRLLCDQLHVALAQSSEAYASAKILSETQLKAIEAPPETPTTGEVLIHWFAPDDLGATLPPGDACAFLMFFCPLADDAVAGQTAVARCSDVQRCKINRLWDGLCADLEHCKPATAGVTAEYIAGRLRYAAGILRGVCHGNQ